MTDQIRFEDGSAYERYMGKWSRLTGDAFLDWLGAPQGWRWLDVGCGNGAFTELIVERTAPRSVQGIDPSPAQLEFARTRHTAGLADFRQGDAMALPFDAATFDAAVMPLVIFFVPEPSRGVAEMRRVVRPGGVVAAYGWDLVNGGFPYAPLQNEMRGMGITIPMPPSPDASRIDVLTDLWNAAGLNSVETREITVTRTFADYEDYWTTILLAPSVGPKLRAMSAGDLAALKDRLRGKLPADAAGRITVPATANAVMGRV